MLEWPSQYSAINFMSIAIDSASANWHFSTEFTSFSRVWHFHNPVAFKLGLVPVCSRWYLWLVPTFDCYCGLSAEWPPVLDSGISSVCLEIHITVTFFWVNTVCVYIHETHASWLMYSKCCSCGNLELSTTCKSCLRSKYWSLSIYMPQCKHFGRLKEAVINFFWRFTLLSKCQWAS